MENSTETPKSILLELLRWRMCGYEVCKCERKQIPIKKGGDNRENG